MGEMNALVGKMDFLNECLLHGLNHNPLLKPGFRSVVTWKEKISLKIYVLLSAGCDPMNIPLPGDMKPEVRRWLASLNCAKRILKRIVGNETMEKEIVGFI